MDALQLRILLFTPHGRPIPGATVVVTGGMLRQEAAEAAPGEYLAEVPRADDYRLKISRYGVPGGFDHRTLRAPLFFAVEGGAPRLATLRPRQGELGGVRAIRAVAGGFIVEAVLDYLWFTPIGYPPTLGNQLDVLVDGEAGWGAAAAEVAKAKRTVHVTTWTYQGTTELRRPMPVSDPPDRVPETVQDILESVAASGATVRLLAWDIPLLRLPPELRRRAEDPGDNFEVLEEANPTELSVFDGARAPLLESLFSPLQIGSYHQKTLVVDGKVGFCGGMNLREVDWDSDRHTLFDARRCRFERRRSFRQMVMDLVERADNVPRHDLTTRIEGPAVAHLEENFRQRWNHLIDKGADAAENASPVAAPEVHAPVEPVAGGVAVQVVRTMPEPFAERGILDVYLRAIAAARKLIYIEDQYFRSTYVSDAIADAVRGWPGLSVIVATMRSQANALLASGWSWECFERIRRRLPSFELYALVVEGRDKEGERVLEEVFNHAKLMIVDDLFLTVGSCNVNDRGFEFEGEINVAVADAALARRTRLGLFREHLLDDPRLNGDIDNDVAVWREHAEANRAAESDPSLPTRSHVFPFVPRETRPLVSRLLF